MAENDPNSSLMREIDDAVRHDKLMNLWNQFKMPLIYATVALIVVTAGSSIWKNYQQGQAEEATKAFNDARLLYVEQRYDESAKAFETLTHQTRGEMADMAKLWRARALLASGKQKTALRTLQNIVIAPEGRNMFWRDLACLHVFGLVKTTAEVPEQCSGKNESTLSPMLAQFYAAGKWSEGDSKSAEKLLDALIKDENVSLDMKMQARAWQTSLRAQRSKE